MTEAQAEIAAGGRFAFGDNWRQFLETIDDAKIEGARQSLIDFLGTKDLSGRTFVDVGSGSGLSSLAARQLGARVLSFDFDPQSVACTQELRRRYDPAGDWRVEQGSALDRDFVASLGTFDIVYSWGVLHHTGDMWTALDVVANLVAPSGLLWLALYNDQGRMSRVWLRVKESYNQGGPLMRRALVAGSQTYFALREAPGRAINRIGGTRSLATRTRGMDKRRDLVDWVGGYPFEVAKPEEVFAFYRDRGFALRELRTSGAGLACNEFLFARRD